MNIIYVDNNATTRVAPEVYHGIKPFLTENYFNPSSMYHASESAAEAIKGARQSLIQALGISNTKELLFTSCATESNNMAIIGAANANPKRRHIITTAVEHPAVLEVCASLKRKGYDITTLSVNTRGELDLGEYIRALRSDTLLVTIMHANNETGVIFPIEQLSRLAKETNPAILFHTDATQTVGKLPIDLSGNFKHVDMLSFSGHKLHAPKGVGALYIKQKTPCRPLLIGGHQEFGRRAGTENVAFIVALAKALEIAMEHHDEDEARISRLRDKLEQELLKRTSYLQVNGENAARLSNTCNLACHYIEGEGILYQLAEYGICASSGSACTSGSLDPSHVLQAMKVPFTAAHGSIRFSLSRYNTEEDIDKIIDHFPTIVANLRRLSPYWDQEKNIPRANPEVF